MCVRLLFYVGIILIHSSRVFIVCLFFTLVIFFSFCFLCTCCQHTVLKPRRAAGNKISTFFFLFPSPFPSFVLFSRVPLHLSPWRRFPGGPHPLTRSLEQLISWTATSAAGPFSDHNAGPVAQGRSLSRWTCLLASCAPASFPSPTWRLTSAMIVTYAADRTTLHRIDLLYLSAACLHGN